LTSAKAQCAQDEQHDDHEADEIDDVVHDDLLTPVSAQRQQRSVVPFKPDGCFAVHNWGREYVEGRAGARPSKLPVARVFTDG
jgi:hypothetical protein